MTAIPEPEISPMPVDPVPPPALPGERTKFACPHCGLALNVVRHRREGDAGVCVYCMGLLILEADEWRQPTFDEAEAWDQETSIQAIRAIWGVPLPGPGPNGEHPDPATDIPLPAEP